VPWAYNVPEPATIALVLGGMAAIKAPRRQCDDEEPGEREID